MPRKHGSRPSQSLFASLPFELKKTLRAKRYEYVEPAPAASSAALAAMNGSGSGSMEAGIDGLLPTQPRSESPSASDVRAEAGGEGIIEAGPSFRSILQPRPPPVLPIPISNGSDAPLTPAKRPLPLSESASLSTAVSSRISAKKRGKRRATYGVEVANRHEGHEWDCTGLVERYTSYDQVPPDLVKYFAQRHALFPLYDDLPLLLDRTGWYSVTPHAIAAHIADRCACDLVVDAFCGVGGNAIEFTRTCERVIAIDNDPIRLRLARHNALQHGVADRIDFILGDYTDFVRSFEARKTKTGETVDVVFLSPPWGGIDYLSTSSPTYPLSAILPIPGSELFDLTSTLTPNIAYYLPRNVDMIELSALARNLDTGAGEEVARQESEGGKVRTKEWVEVEEEWVGDKLKAVTAYFGGLVADT